MRTRVVRPSKKFLLGHELIFPPQKTKKKEKSGWCIRLIGNKKRPVVRNIIRNRKTEQTAMFVRTHQQKNSGLLFLSVRKNTLYSLQQPVPWGTGVTCQVIRGLVQLRGYCRGFCGCLRPDLLPCRCRPQISGWVVLPDALFSSYADQDIVTAVVRAAA
jgi:hypothetical protein